VIAGERVRLRPLERDVATCGDAALGAVTTCCDVGSRWAFTSPPGGWRCRHAEFGIMIGDKDFWSCNVLIMGILREEWEKSKA
jgi:hypothetical protein